MAKFAVDNPDKVERQIVNAITDFMRGWRSQDWIRMQQKSEPHFEVHLDDTQRRQIIAASLGHRQIKKWTYTKVNILSPIAADVYIEHKYQDTRGEEDSVTTTMIKLKVLCEPIAGDPNYKPKWLVNPYSAIKEYEPDKVPTNW